MELGCRSGASEGAGSSLAAAGGLKGMSPVWEYEGKQELDPLSLPGLPGKLSFPSVGSQSNLEKEEVRNRLGKEA